MVHPAVLLKAQIDQPVVAAPFVGVNDRFQPGFMANHRLQSGFGGIGHDLRVDLVAAFQQPEDDGFACRSTASPATHTPCTEVRLVGLQFAFERRDFCALGGQALAQTLEQIVVLRTERPARAAV